MFDIFHCVAFLSAVITEYRDYGITLDGQAEAENKQRYFR